MIYINFSKVGFGWKGLHRQMFVNLANYTYFEVTLYLKPLNLQNKTIAFCQRVYEVGKKVRKKAVLVQGCQRPQVKLQVLSTVHWYICFVFTVKFTVYSFKIDQNVQVAKLLCVLYCSIHLRTTTLQWKQVTGKTINSEPIQEAGSIYHSSDQQQQNPEEPV